MLINMNNQCHTLTSTKKKISMTKSNLNTLFMLVLFIYAVLPIKKQDQNSKKVDQKQTHFLPKNRPKTDL